MSDSEFILDADSEDSIDLTDESAVEKLKPTTDVAHSILEPMKIEPLKLPQHIIDQMMASYDVVCLNDFQDMYHMSEEERKRSFQFYEVFREMRMIKIKHRTLNSYVEAYRIMLKVLNAVAEVNGVYEKDEFIKKVLKGKIKVSGLKKPKYVGRGKKDINWELVSEYILDLDKDPKDLMKYKNEAYFDCITEDDIKELEEDLGTTIEDYMDSHEDVSDKYLEEIDVEETDVAGMNVVIPLSKKEQRNLLKNNRGILIGIKDAAKMRNSNVSRIYSSYAYELTRDAFDEIKERDESTGRIKLPEFKGSAMNKSDVDRYMYVLDEYDRAHTKIEYNGRYYTPDDIDEMELKRILENNGFDIRKFYSYKKDEKRIRKQQKRDKEKIKRLKKTLKKAEKRYEERDSHGKVNHKKKKSKKGKKKGKKISNHVATSSGYESFDDYARMMESWSD